MCLIIGDRIDSKKDVPNIRVFVLRATSKRPFFVAERKALGHLATIQSKKILISWDIEKRTV